MNFRPIKCKLMSFTNRKPVLFDYTLDNVVLLRVERFTDLGLTVNNRLTWDDHIDLCVKIANMRLGFVKHSTGYTVHNDIKKQCYTSLVRLLLESSSILWSGCSKKCLTKLESVQRRATRYYSM